MEKVYKVCHSEALLSPGLTILFGFGVRKSQFFFLLFNTFIVPSENDLQSTGAEAGMC